jgi:hypothetical protein
MQGMPIEKEVEIWNCGIVEIWNYGNMEMLGGLNHWSFP